MALVLNEKKFNISAYLRSNAVMILFVVLCIICLMFSGQDLNNVVNDLTGRMGRNVFIVLALIIPVVAGMGINFAITIGAMAAQIACLWTVELGIGGIGGMALAAGITVPLAAFFGFLIGKLMNKMKGQEMIGGLILGYFANGLYQLLFLFVFGNLIPLKAPGLVIQGSTGVANTIDLSTERGFKYALDNVWKMPLLDAFYLVIFIAIVAVAVMLLLKKMKQKRAFTIISLLLFFVLLTVRPAMPMFEKVYHLHTLATPLIAVVAGVSLLTVLLIALKVLNQKLGMAVIGGAAFFTALLYLLNSIFKVNGLALGNLLQILMLCYIVFITIMILTKVITAKQAKFPLIALAVLVLCLLPPLDVLFAGIEAPMMTFMIVALLCLFNTALLKTRLGQNFRAVGQNRTVANASGINVDRVRIIAIMISTVLAGWGQLIFVQNMGSFQTYGAHEQVGLYAGAAILVGGASIRKATNSQAILGCILFHLMFIVVPDAGKVIFGDAAIGEYFRVFISYGVIALALVMHAWSGIQKKKNPREALSVR